MLPFDAKKILRIESNEVKDENFFTSQRENLLFSISKEFFNFLLFFLLDVNETYHQAIFFFSYQLP
jgi:hypothetical protein